MTPPELPRDAPWTGIFQPGVPRPLMGLGNETHLTTANSLGMEIKHAKKHIFVTVILQNHSMSGFCAVTNLW